MSPFHRQPLAFVLALVLAASVDACASRSSRIPRWSPDVEVPLPASSQSQIQMAAVRQFHSSDQQIMCIGVVSAHEFDTSGGLVVDPSEILLRLLGSRNQYRPYSGCQTTQSNVGGGARPAVRTLAAESATVLVLYTPFGLAADRAGVNLSVRSTNRLSSRYRCEAQAAGSIWEIVRCRRGS